MEIKLEGMWNILNKNEGFIYRTYTDIKKDLQGLNVDNTTLNLLLLMQIADLAHTILNGTLASLHANNIEGILSKLYKTDKKILTSTIDFKSSIVWSLVFSNILPFSVSLFFKFSS